MTRLRRAGLRTVSCVTGPIIKRPNRACGASFLICRLIFWRSDDLGATRSGKKIGWKKKELQVTAARRRWKPRSTWRYFSDCFYQTILRSSFYPGGQNYSVIRNVQSDFARSRDYPGRNGDGKFSSFVPTQRQTRVISNESRVVGSF